MPPPDLCLRFEYDPDSTEEWLLAYAGTRCIAKVRLRRSLARVIIKFITVHPAFERRGVARSLVGIFQGSHEEVLAKGVKYGARGFWRRVGFHPSEDPRFWRWRRSEQEPGREPPSRGPDPAGTSGAAPGG